MWSVGAKNKMDLGTDLNFLDEASYKTAEDWKQLEGRYVYHDKLKAWVRIYSVTSMRSWYFMVGKKVVTAKIPLIYFIKKGLVSDEPRLKGKN